ncbi:MAG: EAL domain-containing protein [Desulfobacterales bacterium]|nr:MAG: EAL domain-containing protein [Desulfobacterales bacterium]
MMGQPLKVLLIEDSEDDAQLVLLELRRGGFKPEYFRVETAEAFREALTRDQWDMVLSDHNLPQFNAPSALAIFNEIGIDIPFIIMSGAVRAADVVDLIKAGAHDFLEKDDLARLVPAIERELREVKIRQKKREAEETLRKLSSAVEQSPSTVIITDDKGMIEYVNPKFEKATGYTAGEVRNQLPDILGSSYLTQEQSNALWKTVRDGQEWRGEFCSQRKSGEMFWEYALVSSIKNPEGETTNYLITTEDITFLKEAEEKIYRQANYDDVTELPNRALIFDRLGQAMVRAKDADQTAALMTISLDNFKTINETLGHEVGDGLLKAVGQRLAECLRGAETAGRVSADEFAVILPDKDSAFLPKIVSGRILEKFAEAFHVDGHELFTTVSIGITVCPMDGDDPGILLRNAVAAMRKAKEDGRNNYQYFSQKMNEESTERLNLETGLRRALEKEELVLFYQPIIEAASKRMVAAEALVRWRNPERGLVSPDQFIFLAEETGLVVSIGDWVLSTACIQAKQMQENGFPNINIAVNVSPEQIWSGSLVRSVQGALNQSGLAPKYLDLEMTEGVCMDDSTTTVETLNQLNRMGVRISIDDFGTGYSSLSYLKRYPFHKLKIDRAFVGDLPSDPDDVALVEAVLAMAKSLGLQVLAEGVETEEQCQYLTWRQCDLLQGFYFSHPMPLEDFLKQA